MQPVGRDPISEGRVAFLFDEVFEVETELVDTFVVLVFQPEVEEGVIEGATHQVLDAEVIRAFWLFASVDELGFVQLQRVSGHSRRCEPTHQHTVLGG